MTDIKRHSVGYLGLEEAKNGRYVAHGDYLEEVKKLKAEIARLKIGIEALGQHACQMLVYGWRDGWVACVEDSEESCEELKKTVAGLVEAL